MDKEAIVKQLEDCYTIAKQNANNGSPDHLKMSIEILNTLYSIKVLDDKA